MFVDALELGLKLTVDGNALVIPGGNVKSAKVNLHQGGFACRVDFVVSSEKATDKLFSSFILKTLMEAEFMAAPHFKPEGARIKPLRLKGIVTEKALLTEQAMEGDTPGGNPILYRLYRVDFADPARVLWGQHFPCDLLVDKTMKDVFEAHKGAKIALTYDWDALDVQYPIISVPLGVEGNEASFHDFALWYIHAGNGVWTYDPDLNSYKISKVKSPAGEASALDRRDVGSYEVRFPETIRHSVKLLNAYSENPQTQAIAQDNAFEGVHRDRIGRFPAASAFQDRQALESGRLKARGHEVHLVFQLFPRKTFTTGSIVKLEGNLWSGKIFPKGMVYRVREIVLEASSIEEELTADRNMAFARYNVAMTSRLETATESVVSLPPFKAPLFPMYVEGKIASEQGEKDEGTYQVYQDSKTSLDQYKVKIPLWENHLVVMAFEPDFFSGHFYFPAYKDARVLAALDFHSAWIVRFLDWRPGARLAADTQGNHLLLGKKAKSQTSLKHVYVDGKPQLNLLRTSDSDTELISLAEGTLILQTKEESGG